MPAVKRRIVGENFSLKSTDLKEPENLGKKTRVKEYLLWLLIERKGMRPGTVQVKEFLLFEYPT